MKRVTQLISSEPLQSNLFSMDMKGTGLNVCVKEVSKSEFVSVWSDSHLSLKADIPERQTPL